ncbi:MAG: TerD family protein [Azoarcus sp.]|jgi:stress response protein SCP2|nr:TerD family protein [Azoarcus sp.]
MAVNLRKGEGVNLSKDGEYDLSMVTMGLGWDVVEQKKKGFAAFFSKAAPDYDLDAIAFLLGKDGKVARLGAPDANGNTTLIGGDVVFFNSMRHPSGCIWLTGDNRTGAGDGDDEQIIVKLDSLPQEYESIIFVVAIYEGKKNRQSFGGVQNAFIRAVDAKNREICRFNISGDSTYGNFCSMTFAEVRRQGNGWTFQAIGTPHETDRFVDLLKNYL